MDPLLIPFGFGVGFLVGMTGMGGGSLMTPLLILVFGTSPVTAVGSDITYAAVTKSVGGWRHLRLRTVNLGLSAWLALGSVPAAIAGVWLGSHLVVRLPSGVLRTALGAIMIAAALALFDKAGYKLPLVVILSVPIVFAVLLGVRALTNRARTQPTSPLPEP